MNSLRVLIELCRIEIACADGSSARLIVLIELCRIEIAAPASVRASRHRFNRTL